VHGDLVTALHDNALFVLGLPALLIVWLLWFRRERTGGTGRLVPGNVLRGVVILALVFGVTRNLAFAAFLAPPG
jgi:hypothetical protein